MSVADTASPRKRPRRPATPRDGLPPMRRQQREYAVMGVLIVLLVYAAPLVLAVVTLPIFHVFDSGLARGMANFFVDLILGRGPISQAPTLLLPLLAALTVAALWSPAHQRATRAAVVIAGLGMLAAVILYYLLNIEPISEHLTYYRPELTSDDDQRLLFDAAKERYVTKALQDLATFLAILLGVKVLPERADASD